MGAAQQQLMSYGAAGGLSTPTPTFANVSLLIHGSARPFIDASLNKHPVENLHGLTTLSGSSMSFVPGTTKIRVPTTAAFLMGTGAWAVTAKVNAAWSQNARILDTRTAIGASNGMLVVIQSSTGFPFVQINGVAYGVGGGGGLPAGNLTTANNVETDVAFSYDGTDLRCFVDGALSWSHTVSLNISVQGSFLAVGNAPGAGDPDAGTYLIRELMVVKGEAVYTSAYTPESVRTDSGIVIEAGAAVTFSNVKLLLHGAGSSGSTTITDSSTAARTPTRFGNTQISNAQARIGTTSIAFDGSGDYLTYTNSADFNFPGDFSVEQQLYFVANTGNQAVMGNYQNGSDGWIQQIAVAAGRMNMNITGDGIDVYTQDSAFPTGAWKHNVSARVGALLMQFVEGELVNFVIDSSSVTSSADLGVGRFAAFGGTEFNGYMQEARVVKGQSPYARSFIVQTAAHPDS